MGRARAGVGASLVLSPRRPGGGVGSPAEEGVSCGRSAPSAPRGEGAAGRFVPWGALRAAGAGDSPVTAATVGCTGRPLRVPRCAGRLVPLGQSPGHPGGRIGRVPIFQTGRPRHSSPTCSRSRGGGFRPQSGPCLCPCRGSRSAPPGPRGARGMGSPPPLDLGSTLCGGRRRTARTAYWRESPFGLLLGGSGSPC